MVEDAIKGLVTKSANDAAAAVGEAIGGTEEDFAKLMTAKARELGMANTTYVNASGLPADEQITTARDQALLAIEIQHRFPVYYRYFATPSFVYRGTEMRNHNMLLGQVKGVDGIKTGYTDASGYNLVSSVRRDNKHLIGVVLGGTSNESRDARMRQLIEDHINLCAVGSATPADAVATAPGAPVAAALAPPLPPAQTDHRAREDHRLERQLRRTANRPSTKPLHGLARRENSAGGCCQNAAVAGQARPAEIVSRPLGAKANGRASGGPSVSLAELTPPSPPRP